MSARLRLPGHSPLTGRGRSNSAKDVGERNTCSRRKARSSEQKRVEEGKHKLTCFGRKNDPGKRHAILRETT